MRRACWLILAAGWLAFAALKSHALPDASPAPAQTPASPHASTDPVKHELTAVVDGQLAAFRAGDFAKAYTFAADGIKEMFPAAEFEHMVRTAYPVIAHSTGSDFGMAFDTGEEAVINVRVQDAEKRSVEYQYLLKKESGTWKITGVSEVKSAGLSV